MKLSRKTIIISVIVILLLGSGVAAYSIWNKDDKQQETNSTTSKADDTKTKTEESTSQPGVTVTTETTTKESSTGSGNVTEVAAPSGSFVSNHKPSLSTSNIVNSICHTTVGATCEIHFTQGATVKILGSNTVGSGGFVSWDWRLQDIGITAGTGQVEAVAKLADKTASTKDSVSLEVSP